MNGERHLRREWRSMPGQAARAVMLIPTLVFLPPMVQGQEDCRVYQRSDFPFVQALHELDTEERKLEHLRSWNVSMGPENGLSKPSYAYY